MSFLSFIAESKVFDLEGYNSIDSAKRSKLYDVLIYASEKKDKDDTISAYYDRLNKK